MDSSDPTGFTHLPQPRREALQRICADFESQWQTGRRPQLEAWLEGLGEPDDCLLFGELLRIDLSHRRRLGEHPAAEDYLDRFGKMANVVRAVFAREATLAPPGPADTLVPKGAEALARSSGAWLPTVPGYEVVEELGRGGMGVVLRVYDRDIVRPLAVKVLLEQHQGRADMETRFREETRLTGQLQHPGVPPVMAMGRLADGRPFFAMKLIQGRTLAELLKERASPGDDRPRFVGIFEQVAQTLAYAHSKGVIHRDLKPSNVMVGAFGEVQVMDWGLAKVLGGAGESARLQTVDSVGLPAACGLAEESRPHTQAGAVLGTPAYMAPEQARGEIHRLDQRSDVFGLGAILCEVLTGQPPYDGPREQILMQVRLGHLAPAYLRLEASAADADLIALARSCLAAQAEDRPRDAGGVAQAVAAYRQGAQERLRQAELERERAQVKAAEESKRRKLWVSLAALLLVLLAGASFTGLLYQQEQGRKQAAQLAQEAELTRQRTVLERDVEGALREARANRRRALELTDSPPAWRAALVEARSALERAVALLRRQPELADEALRDRVTEASAALAADDRDRLLVEQCEQVSLEQTDLEVVGGRIEFRALFPRIKKALVNYGLAVGQMPIEEAVRLITSRPAPVQGKVLTALLLLQMGIRVKVGPPASQPQEIQWGVEVLRQADRGPWRRQVLEAMSKEDVAALTRLAEQPEAEGQPAAWLEVLAGYLPVEPSLRLLRGAQRRHPGDFWINHSLGQRLHTSVASAVRMEVGTATAADLAALDEATSYFRAALAVRPQTAAVWISLGVILKRKGDVAGAIAAYKRAIELEPRAFWAYSNLGVILHRNGKVDEAIAAYKRAIELEPRCAQAHTHLGVALQKKGRLSEAVASSQRAIDLQPRYALAHNNLGGALLAKGEVQKALVAYRRAIQEFPQYAQAHFNLGWALQVNQDVDGAIAAYRQAIKLEPRFHEAHSNLGLVLKAKGDLKGAIVAHQRATELAPHNARIHGALGATLLRDGEFDRAAAATQRCLELLSTNDRLRPMGMRQLRQCRELAALDRRLAAVLSGQSQPRDGVEALKLATLCLEYKRRYVASVRFFDVAYAASPPLPEDQATIHRYNAACAAALACCGRGEDAGSLDDKDRVRLRNQALKWLQAALPGMSATSSRQQVLRTLKHWLNDPALAGLRDPEALARLPAGERQDWQKLWAEVARRLDQAGGSREPGRPAGVSAGRQGH
jgi:serine/threonine protein kinase/Flp pilus assembly protein TadD